MNSDELLITKPANIRATIILAHGAGAAMDSPFMNYMADGLSQRDIQVIRFEFPYMRKRRMEGTKSPPNTKTILLQTWRDMAAGFQGSAPLFIGGKSMGGRIASMIADEVRPKGLICLGYPFHPPGKKDKLRTEHLLDLKTRCLIVQGERDPFGTLAEVPQYQLSKAISLAWVPDGDHSFKPRKSSGLTQEQNWDDAVLKMAAFIHSHS